MPRKKPDGSPGQRLRLPPGPERDGLFGVSPMVVSRGPVVDDETWGAMSEPDRNAIGTSRRRPIKLDAEAKDRLLAYRNKAIVQARKAGKPQPPGFTLDHIREFEALASRFKWEMDDVKELRKEARVATAKARKQLLQGTALVGTRDGEVLAWIRGLGNLALYGLARCLPGRPDKPDRLDVLDRLRLGEGTKRDLAIVRSALPGIAGLAEPDSRGRPGNDAHLALIAGIQLIWARATGERRGRSVNPTPAVADQQAAAWKGKAAPRRIGKDSESGPFLATVRACMKAAGHEPDSSLDESIRILGQKPE